MKVLTWKLFNVMYCSINSVVLKYVQIIIAYSNLIQLVPTKLTSTSCCSNVKFNVSSFKMHCRTLNIDPTLTGQHTVMNVASHMLSSNVFHITISCGDCDLLPSTVNPLCSLQCNRIVFTFVPHLKLRTERLSLQGAHL